MRRDHYAIVIGINTYPGLSSLGGSCADAQAFHDWIVNPVCGGVPPGNVRLLLTTQFHPPGPDGIDDAHPFEDDVNAQFRPYVEQGRKGRIGARLYMYFAGHGFADPNDIESAALITANAVPYFAPHITGTAYANWFRRNAVFDEVVLVMDCCRSIVPIQPLRPPPLPNTGNPSRASEVRFFYAFAAMWGDVARERAMNGAVRGIFTTAFLDALQRASPNHAGNVTGDIVKAYVHNHIDAIAGSAEIAPPEIRVDANRDIVFLKRSSSLRLNVHIRLAPYAAGEIVAILGGDGREIARGIAREEVLKFELEPGFYKVSVIGTERQKLFEVVAQDVTETI